ncbi:Putative methyltransferase [Planctomycetes bacterium Poly30]|uniref:Methyltransferase n=1 Tax=Saltatorellus ferox TaxID=2528018 RepID=A0A518F0W6_9BACT|nr:Putative methyltransferase [Planctomycetes bacterium Poly30]
MIEDPLPDPRLPAIEGGWALRTFDLGNVLHDGGPEGDGGAGSSIRLWVPADPDRLLDDEAVQERNRANDSMPYWAWLWDSAPTMGHALRQRKIRGRVLEVGAGLGFNGIVAATQTGEALELTLSDHDPLSLAALRANADLNQLRTARVWDLDWNRLEMAPPESFDVILGCDVIYEAQGHRALLATCRRFLGDEGRVFLADPGRSRVPELVGRAQDEGWHVTIEDADGLEAEPEVGAFRVIVLTRGAARDRSEP